MSPASSDPKKVSSSMRTSFDIADRSPIWSKRLQRPCQPGAVAGPPPTSVAGLFVDHVVQRLAGLVAPNVLDEDVDAALAGEGGRGAVVRRHDRVRQVPEG